MVEQFNQSGASVQGLVTFTGRPGYLSWAMHLKPGVSLCSVATALKGWIQLCGGRQGVERCFSIMFFLWVILDLGVGQELGCPPFPASPLITFPPPPGTSGKVGMIQHLFSAWAALD